MTKRILSIMLALSLIFCMTGMTAFAETGGTVTRSAAYSDTVNHWASVEISKWSDLGILQGSNGSFRPNAPITRAEMAIILDRVMGYQVKSQNIFSDLTNTWYTDAVLRANAAGIILGSNGEIRPTDNISRQEAAIMLCRALGVKESTGNTSFVDNASIASWAKGYVKAAVTAQLFNGVGDNHFAPTASINRASVGKMLDNAIESLVTTTDEQTDTVNGNVVVNRDGAVLKNMRINGNLIIAEGVGDGEVTLDSVVVTGDTIIRGGGANSIHIKGDSKLGKVTVAKNDDGTIAIKISGNAKVDVIFAENGTIIISGDFGRLNITGDVSVSLVGATVQTVNVTAPSARLKVDASSKVTTLVANQSVIVDNKGAITTAQINASGTVIDGNKPSAITVAPGVTAPKDSSGNTVTSDTITGGGATGGGGSYVPPVTSVTVNNFSELQSALSNPAIKQITMTSSITTTAPTTVSSGQTLNIAPGTTLTLGANLTVNGTLSNNSNTTLVLDGGNLVVVSGHFINNGNTAGTVNEEITVTGTASITNNAGKVINPIIRIARGGWLTLNNNGGTASTTSGTMATEGGIYLVNVDSNGVVSLKNNGYLSSLYLSGGSASLENTAKVDFVKVGADSQATTARLTLNNSGTVDMLVGGSHASSNAYVTFGANIGTITDKGTNFLSAQPASSLRFKWDNAAKWETYDGPDGAEGFSLTFVSGDGSIFAPGYPQVVNVSSSYYIAVSPAADTRIYGMRQYGESDVATAEDVKHGHNTIGSGATYMPTRSSSSAYLAVGATSNLLSIYTSSNNEYAIFTDEAGTLARYKITYSAEPGEPGESNLPFDGYGYYKANQVSVYTYYWNQDTAGLAGLASAFTNGSNPATGVEVYKDRLLLTFSSNYTPTNGLTYTKPASGSMLYAYDGTTPLATGTLDQNRINLFDPIIQAYKDASGRTLYVELAESLEELSFTASNFTTSGATFSGLTRRGGSWSSVADDYMYGYSMTATADVTSQLTFTCADWFKGTTTVTTPGVPTQVSGSMAFNSATYNNGAIQMTFSTTDPMRILPSSFPHSCYFTLTKDSTTARLSGYSSEYSSSTDIQTYRINYNIKDTTNPFSSGDWTLKYDPPADGLHNHVNFTTTHFKDMFGNALSLGDLATSGVTVTIP